MPQKNKVLPFRYRQISSTIIGKTNSEIWKKTSYNTKPELKNSSDHEVFGSILSSFSNETRETLATDNINRVVTKYSSKITQRQLSVEK